MVCSLSRRQLSNAAAATAKLSIVAVINYDGAEEELKNIFKAIEACKQEDEAVQEWISKNGLDEWGRPPDYRYKKHPSTSGTTTFEYISRAHPTRPWLQSTAGDD